jgi:phosphoglucomutase/phosphomannomutase
MSETSIESGCDAALATLTGAANAGRISPSAVANLRNWLSDPVYARYRPAILEHIAQAKWQALDDVFWTVIPFGTGGRRGTMYPFGSNAINERTIGESAQGLASYVRQTKPDGPWTCGIAYDTRHRSREFAELCAGILVANGFTVFFIDDYRSTPELSFLVRYKKCDCGIMVTASHNPPSDNAVKVYWSSGAQLIPPHDKAVIEQVMQVREFPIAEFGQSVADGKIILCKEDVDAALLAEHLRQSYDGPRQLDVIYSPLHGVGEFNVKSLLHAAGFQDVEIYGPHREPNGDFPNVPGHVSNPENPQVFSAIIERARKTGAELILATDPDCDRMGAAAPLTTDSSGPWATLNGNQLAVLLADFVMEKRRSLGLSGPNDYVVTTIVTTLMVRRIAESYGVACYNNNLVGFKWICSVIDDVGPEGFVFGAEESHGYLVGTYARDKDGAVACMLMSELAAECRAKGMSVHEKMDELYRRHGYHGERLATIRMEGSDGMRRMQEVMEKLRNGGPTKIGGLAIASLRDYLNSTVQYADGRTVKLEGPVDNLIVLETDIDGNYVAVRPSGTEPKVKMYMFTFVPPQFVGDLERTRVAMEERLHAFARDIEAFAESV